MTAQVDLALVPLVTLDEVRRRLGWPRHAEPEAMMATAAAEQGMQLEILEDWAGRRSIPAGQAAELVGRVEASDQAAAQAGRRADRAHTVAALEADQRCEARAQLAYDLALRTFADEGVALVMAHHAARQDVTDEDLTAGFGSAAERWRQGYRTLAPAPVAATTELQEQVSAEVEAAQINRTGQIPARAMRRAAEAMQGKRRFQR